ncbi:MAG TPA: hypothetical protein VJX92_13630 [Methylomirabilota bacterium]|nr:hypothetical protein [Methylomirabilota bacterium]
MSREHAAFFDRVARRRLVSVRFEIRALLYVGVVLLTSGVGLLVAEHHRQIGPLAVAGGIGLVVAACFVWLIRKAPAFSWEAVESPNVALDYVLLLGLLLFASDLAYLEVQLALLGPRWAYHLLVVAVVYLLAAYRWDSRVVLSLALTTLAAWRGISVGLIPGSSGALDATLRGNALALAALSLAAAALSVRLARKTHFEDVYANAGLLLGLGALVSGTLDDEAAWTAWLLALLVVAGLVMWLALRLGRSLYFAEGVVAAYLGLVRLLFEPFHSRASSIPFLFAALLGAGVLVLLGVAHRRMRER